MTTSFAQTNNQDSISYRDFVIQDTLKISTDSANVQISIDTVSYEIPIYEEAKDSSFLDSAISVMPVRSNVIRRREIDTVSVYSRNPVADIIFASPDYIHLNSVNRFPFQLVQKNNDLLSEKKERIEKSLKNGEALPATPFHNDWIIGIIIFAILLFSIVYTSTKTFFPDIARFFLFRVTKESGNKAPKIFYWKIAFLNISSFLLISIFVYFAVSYSGIIPAGLSEFKIWFYSAVIVVIAFMLRYLACTATGLLSDATEVFNDYIITIYQTYRFAGLFLSIVVILFFYTPLITAKICLITGCTIVTLLYLIRILRLFLLFINYNISILYFILYLCALEIMPVLILIKYFSGLVHNWRV